MTSYELSTLKIMKRTNVFSFFFKMITTTFFLLLKIDASAKHSSTYYLERKFVYREWLFEYSFILSSLHDDLKSIFSLQMPGIVGYEFS